LGSIFYTSGQKENILEFSNYMELVRMHHPVAVQARLNPEFGDASLRSARGGFDPLLYSNINQKNFDEENYYSLIDAGLKLPTWFGIEVYSGWERNDGVNLNPERKTPEMGLFYAGVSVPIGRNLFIDERRASLRNAQLFEDISLEEQRLMLNKVLIKAAKAYWDWYAAYHKMEVYREGLQLAEVRFEGVRESALQGDKPIIDTVEAHIQMQSRMISFQKATLEFENQSEHLSVFLWDTGTIPLEVPDDMKPEERRVLSEYIRDLTVNSQIDSMIVNHPVIKQKELKIDQLNINRRLKLEQLKPVINLKYNAINEPIGGNVISGYTINNYNWGLQFYMPLLLRKGRGEVKLAKLKMQDAQMDLVNYIAIIRRNVNQSINTWRVSTTQVSLSEKQVQSLSQLLEGERIKFDVGESSLFLVNAREMSYISGQISLINEIAKNQTSLIDISYQLGVLGD
jgi:outer membrane protein TolC